MESNEFISVIALLMYVKTKKRMIQSLKEYIFLTNHTKLFVTKSRKSWEEENGGLSQAVRQVRPPRRSGVECPASNKDEVSCLL